MLKLILLIVGIALSGSVQLITTPLIMPVYPSIFFITLTLSIESSIVFGLIMLVNDIVGLYNKKQWSFDYTVITKHPKNILGMGILQFLISICFFYSSNPNRTPVLMQVILLGLCIIPSVIFSKIILNKRKNYQLNYLIYSMCFLLVSIILGVIPLAIQTELADTVPIQSNQSVSTNQTTTPIVTNKSISILWCCVFMIGVVFMALSNVLQERYINATNKKASTKFKFAFFTRLVQLLLTIIMFWTEPLLGYNNTFSNFFSTFGNDYLKSIQLFFGSSYGFWIIQLYVIGRVISYILLIYLNQISANYSTIISGINTQILGLFFAIFPSLNTGFQYPLTVTMLNIFCNISSIIFWIKAEKAPIDNDENTVDQYNQTVCIELDETTNLWKKIEK